METKTFIRDSKMEILRIISMILIVMHHFSVHGGYIINESIPFFNVCVKDFFAVGGKLGVNIFVMLSGYFLINGKFKLSKLLKIILKVFFFSIVIYLFFLLLGKATFNWEILIKNLFPIIFNQYWFITIYVIVYLLSPFINKMVKQLSYKELSILIVILISFQSIFTMFTNNYFSSVGWFITVYLIGAFIKLYGKKFMLNVKINAIIFFVSYLLLFIFEAFTSHSIYQMNHIVCLIATISLFNIFALSNKQFTNKFINIVASSTFGIYLIHDNNFLRSFIWKELLRCPQMIANDYFIIFAIFSVISVFIVCCLIDLIYTYILEKPITKYFRLIISKRSMVKTNIREVE